MPNRKAELGLLVKRLREAQSMTQEDLANAVGNGVNRQVIGYLEQGARIPRFEILNAICVRLGVPSAYWEPFTNPEALLRFEFEDLLWELTGVEVSAEDHPLATRAVVEAKIRSLFTESFSKAQTVDLFNSVLVFYGVRPISGAFFDRYLASEAFFSIKTFSASIARYQLDATRLFATLREAFLQIGSADELSEVLAALEPRSLDAYRARTEWNGTDPIPEARLADLGYISAQRIQTEASERLLLTEFLRELAAEIDEKGDLAALSSITPRQEARMNSLLRKFDSTIQHGIGSSLFSPDTDELRRESERLKPKTEEELEKIAATQQQALRNLANYLAADHLDVYVATSMRTEADFISVNRFVDKLFLHAQLKPLKLRYFNPTQSWIDDRIAKGLVEALMLRRSSLTIYMAQKSDTFGKDSEASVALGQGKPVIVYVPKLELPGEGIDAESLIKQSRSSLLDTLQRLTDDPELKQVDPTVDNEALTGRILNLQLSKVSDRQIIDLVLSVWADFDLYGESERFRKTSQEAAFRAWLDGIVFGGAKIIPQALRAGIVSALVAVGLRMEARAKVFREIHPLALQVILSTGVLNGILVARTPNQCAEVMEALLRNELRLTLITDDNNYRVVEDGTDSTIRVISRNRLLQHSFDRFYSLQ